MSGNHERAKELAHRSYCTIVRKEQLKTGEVIWTAISPEFLVVAAQGDTPQEAFEALIQVRQGCIEHYLDNNIEVPEPQLTQTGSKVEYCGDVIETKTVNVPWRPTNCIGQKSDQGKVELVEYAGLQLA